MKTRKIHGVPRSVCVAEQKIAYNIASRAQGLNVSPRRALEMAAPDLRFDRTAILSALTAGWEAYRSKPFIALGYAEIGAAFPLAEVAP